MDRRSFLTGLIALGSVSLLGSCSRASGSDRAAPLGIPLTEWADRLDRRVYAVLFEEATERAHTSSLNGEKREGTYVCAACQNPIFNSWAKYESGTGWPSFWQVIDHSIGTRTDNILVMPRTEYHCANCGGHQGHVFRDGPNPTEMRYCNNGVSLIFIPKDEALPKRLERIA